MPVIILKDAHVQLDNISEYLKDVELVDSEVTLVNISIDNKESKNWRSMASKAIRVTAPWIPVPQL
jgi:hypothetical protein